MKITFYGHSSIGIEVSGKQIIIDPFITGNPKASHIDITALKADYILLTHAHQDHTLDVETIAKNTNAVIVSNYEVATYYGNKGFQYHPELHHLPGLLRHDTLRRHHFHPSQKDKASRRYRYL